MKKFWKSVSILAKLRTKVVTVSRMRSKYAQQNPNLQLNRRNFRVVWKIGVEELDGDAIF